MRQSQKKQQLLSFLKSKPWRSSIQDLKRMEGEWDPLAKWAPISKSDKEKSLALFKSLSLKETLPGNFRLSTASLQRKESILLGQIFSKQKKRTISTATGSITSKIWGKGSTSLCVKTLWKTTQILQSTFVLTSSTGYFMLWNALISQTLRFPTWHLTWWIATINFRVKSNLRMISSSMESLVYSSSPRSMK